MRQCQMCKTDSLRTRHFFEWISFTKETLLHICAKCTKREVGKSKKWKLFEEEMKNAK